MSARDLGGPPAARGRAGIPHALEDVARVLGEESGKKLVLDIVADIERIER